MYDDSSEYTIAELVQNTKDIDISDASDIVKEKTNGYIFKDGSDYGMYYVLNKGQRDYEFNMSGF